MLATTSTDPRPRPPGQGGEPSQDVTTDGVIVMRDVTMQFPDQLAVDGISLVVPRGTILGVIGPSGAGKTTTIRLLTGALTPTKGEISVLGEEPRKFRRQTRERIGYMPQRFTLYPDLTVRENVDFVGSLFGMIFWSRRRRTGQVLKLVDLWDVRSRRAGRLSGGMQRRLELACALVHDPALLFLDEPTAGVDPMLRARIWEELHRQRDAGRTLLVTTQYVNEAEQCDRVALIADGRLLALATPDELRRDALGGDVVEVETAALFDSEQIFRLPFVRGVRQDGPRRLSVIVDDAATAIPDVVQAIDSHGGEVVSAREVRPSFDDVFAALVERGAVIGDGASDASRDETVPATGDGALYVQRPAPDVSDIPDEPAGLRPDLPDAPDAPGPDGPDAPGPDEPAPPSEPTV
ncbi:MAG TPA: ATP-binding cassette domain-containing protein [Candidatus Limnocylindrales bacterium]|nr:ATP-binding cassette domain-containing protein [Candidatus Limnocylindrales bacterium]